MLYMYIFCNRIQLTSICILPCLLSFYWSVTGIPSCLGHRQWRTYQRTQPWWQACTSEEHTPRRQLTNDRLWLWQRAETHPVPTESREDRLKNWKEGKEEEEDRWEFLLTQVLSSCDKIYRRVKGRAEEHGQQLPTEFHPRLTPFSASLKKIDWRSDWRRGRWRRISFQPRFSSVQTRSTEEMKSRRESKGRSSPVTDPVYISVWIFWWWAEDDVASAPA